MLKKNLVSFDIVSCDIEISCLILSRYTVFLRRNIVIRFFFSCLSQEKKTPAFCFSQNDIFFEKRWRKNAAISYLVRRLYVVRPWLVWEEVALRRKKGNGSRVGGNKRYLYENIGGGAATIGAWKIIADWSENASRENMAVPEKPKTLIRIDRAADEPFFPH